MYKFILPKLPDENCAGEISEYAKDSTCEFVAEYIAGRMAGKKYSKRVDELYLEYGGPNIFNKV